MRGAEEQQAAESAKSHAASKAARKIFFTSKANRRVEHGACGADNRKKLMPLSSGESLEAARLACEFQ
jgi:hypothetical protein